MKITVEVLPESEIMHVIYVLMNRTAFKEIERVVVGGHMSSVMLVITFQGADSTFDMLKNSIYVSILVPNSKKLYTFYSLTCLNGITAECEEEFKNKLEQNIMTKPEIKYFNSKFDS